MRKLFSPAFLVLAFISFATTASAQPPAPGGQGQGGRGGGGRQGGPPAPPAAKKVVEGLYMITGIGGNTTVRVDNEGLILVDTKNLGEANYNQLLEVVKTISTAPVKQVFITHHHQDHSGNIGLFQRDGAQVTVHANLNKNLETYNPQAGKPEQAKLTYATDKKVKVGKARAEAHHYGRGHTNGDTFVWFPDVKIISAGDMIVATAPNADMAFGGSLVEWIKTLDKVQKLPYLYVIPGHGNDPLTRADVSKFREKWNTVLTRMVELVKAGTPKEELLAKVKVDDLEGWTVQSFAQPGRLDPLYAELQALAGVKTE